MKPRDDVKDAMKILGIQTLRKHQIKPIHALLDRKDIFLVAPTSAGKSAILQIPALVQAKQGMWTLIIEPTVSLLRDQVRQLKESGVAAEYLAHDNIRKHERILSMLSNGEVGVLYTTPERLHTPAFQQAIQGKEPWMIAVDECHCVLDWGYTFRNAYLHIQDFIEGLESHPVIAAVTATAPAEYHKEIVEAIGLHDPEIFLNSLVRNNITLLEEDCNDLTLQQKLKRVKTNIKRYQEDGRAVIYCTTKKHVDIVANYLKEQFPGQIVKCHSYMEAEERERHEKLFITGKRNIMVATSAFGMGVNVPDIRLVLHFGLPLSVVDYYQQYGRAGRDGNRSHAVLLHSQEDLTLNRWVTQKATNSKQLDRWLKKRQQDMVDLVMDKQCMAQHTLELLGEANTKACRYCTHCQLMRRERK
jgi:RecQ family ATP-dependent DNA helicase